MNAPPRFSPFLGWTMLCFVVVDVVRALAGADIFGEGVLAPWWEYVLVFVAGWTIATRRGYRP